MCAKYWQPESADLEDDTADALEDRDYIAEAVAFIRRMQEVGATAHNPEWAAELRAKLEHRHKCIEARLGNLRTRRGELPGGRRL